MGVDDFFGFRPEGKIGEDDVALLAQQEAGKGEIDT